MHVEASDVYFRAFTPMQEHLLGKAASLAGATHQQEMSKVWRGKGEGEGGGLSHLHLSFMGHP